MAGAAMSEDKDSQGGAGGDTLSSFFRLRRRDPWLQEALSTGDAKEPLLSAYCPQKGGCC